ncbi:NADH dehydrogenase [ubiquinone] 1 alpha subcomplex subunit 7 [Toxocara canis]|nr:NADH dehydrogenase [ubiquinone] 1 alpha subcomplex subunit 7 [Toxocara canis]
MASGQKIASATVKNRSQAPFWVWLRNKLLAVDRLKTTPPPGLETPDGKAVYHNNLRYPNSQSARTQPPPSLPGGIHHRLSDVYYLERDARRTVMPPSPLYTVDESGVKYGTPLGEEIPREKAIQVNKGPGENFGLEAPTPGFGYEWKRDRSEELATQKYSSDLSYLEKFDRFNLSK